MKKSLIALTALFISLPSIAEVNSGFYRIQNYKSERYAYMLDDKAILDKAATKVDLSAVELFKELDNAIADPATVIYITKNGNNYDLTAQGTSVHNMIGEYLHLRLDDPTNRPDAYLAYGTYSGLTKYLCDNHAFGKNEVRSLLSDNGKAGNVLSNWTFIPIDINTDNYFGIQATVSGNNGDFTTLYMGFDLNLSNAESEAYVISQVDNELGYAIYETLEGTIPAKVPVIIKTSGTNVADNKAVPALASSSYKPENQLSGVFFQNTRTNHENYLKYDNNTMRVLGVLSDGSVGFVQDLTKEYVDRNKAYLKVDANCPAELKLISKEEYEHMDGITDITNYKQAIKINGRTIDILQPAKNIAVYNMLGSKIHSGGANSITIPTSGIYFITIDSSTYKIQIK